MIFWYRFDFLVVTPFHDINLYAVEIWNMKLGIFWVLIRTRKVNITKVRRCRYAVQFLKVGLNATTVRLWKVKLISSRQCKARSDIGLSMSMTASNLWYLKPKNVLKYLGCYNLLGSTMRNAISIRNAFDRLTINRTYTLKDMNIYPQAGIRCFIKDGLLNFARSFYLILTT